MYLGCGGDQGDPVVDSDLMEELAREVSTTEFTVNRKLTALHVHVSCCVWVVFFFLSVYQNLIPLVASPLLLERKPYGPQWDVSLHYIYISTDPSLSPIFLPSVLNYFLFTKIFLFEGLRK